MVGQTREPHGSTPAGTDVPVALLERITAEAEAVDRGDAETLEQLVAFGEAGLTTLGSVSDTEGRPGQQSGQGGLPDLVGAVEALARRSLSSAFALWGHRMAIEYLLAADTPYAHRVLPGLRAGAVPGVSGMASAFRRFVGAGEVDLTARADGEDLLIDGTLPWATNLYPGALVVSAAVDAQGDPLLLAFTLDQQGVEVGAPLDLLALRGTRSTSVRLNAVRVPGEQVLSRDFTGLLRAVRPTFAALQSALCLGLAAESLAQTEVSLGKAAEGSFLTTFAPDLAEAQHELGRVRGQLDAVAATVGTGTPPTPAQVLQTRHAAGLLAVQAAGLELRTAGGRAFVHGSAANRRFRESAFLPVQSPSEGQLRWELARG